MAKANPKANPKAKPNPKGKPKPKPKASPAAPRGDVRGAALVELVIAHIEVAGGTLSGCGIRKHAATPLAPKILSKLTLPNHRPLPPSLARFLAYDASYLGVLDKKHRLLVSSFSAMVEREHGKHAIEMFAGFEKVLTAPCLIIPGGSDSRRFLYLGEPDEHGEYPVFISDDGDGPFVCVAYPGLDVYLADGTLTKVIKGNYSDGFKNRTYKAAMIDQARRNFLGLENLDYHGSRHVDGPDAAAATLQRLFGAPSLAEAALL